MPQLSIRLFGEIQIAHDGQPWLFKTRPKVPPLFALTILAGGDAVSRASLAARLWPEASEAEAKANLRRHLHALVSTLPLPDESPWFEITRHFVRWRPLYPATVDVLDFLRFVENANTAAQAVALYRGPLLDGTYDEAIMDRRHWLEAQAMSALSSLTTAARVNHDYEAAIGYAQEMLRIDDMREDALRMLMIARYERGDKSAALAAYERFSEKLRVEMGVEPMPETQALRASILADRTIGGNLKEIPPSERATGPIFGREAPLSRLREQWRRAARRSGTAAFISGEAGIGKSRICDELAVLVERDGGRVLTGRTSSPEAAPYEALIAALRQGLALVDPQSFKPEWLSAIAPLIPEATLLRDDVPDAPPQGERAQLRLHETLARLFETIAKTRPITVILEDMHQAHQATLDAFEAVARRTANSAILFVVTIRDDDSSNGVERVRTALCREARATQVPLARLSPEHVAGILDNVPECAAAGTELRRAVVHFSEGNPLFVWQLIEGFLESGVIPKSGAEIARITDLIESRLARLPAEAIRLGATAAAIGVTFTTDILCDVGGWPESEVQEALSILTDRRLVRESSVSHFEYTFTHALIASVFYDQTPVAGRPARHRRIATCLQRRQVNADSAALARHWRLALEPEAAADAYLHAANAALRVHAHADAAAYADDAYALTLEDKKRFDALRIAVDARLASGDVDAHTANVKDLVTLAQALGSDERFIALVAQERLMQRTGKAVEQAAIIESMLTLAHETKSSEQLANAYYAQGALLYGQGKFFESLTSLKLAVSHANDCGDRSIISMARGKLVQALTRESMVTEAVSQLDAYREFCNQDILEERAHLLYAQHPLHILKEDGEALYATGAELFEVAGRLGDLEMQGKAQWIMGGGAELRGDASAAQMHYRFAANYFEQLRQPQSLSATLISLGFVLITMGRYEQAIAVTAEGERNAREAGAQHLAVQGLINRADAVRLAGRHEEALQLATSAHAAALELGTERLVFTVASVLGALACSVGNMQGLDKIRSAIEFFRGAGSSLSAASDLALFVECAHDAGAQYMREVVEAGNELQKIAARYTTLRDPVRIYGAIALAASTAKDTTCSSHFCNRARTALEAMLASIEDVDARQAYRSKPFYAWLLAEKAAPVH